MKLYFFTFFFFSFSCNLTQNSVAPEQNNSEQKSTQITETSSEKKVIDYEITAVNKSGSIKKSKNPDSTAMSKMYLWKRTEASYTSVFTRFPAPSGFKRIKASKNSYGYWLRYLPVRKVGTKVFDYSGDELSDSSDAAAAVIDLDIGTRDLQQCMDTIIRLRAEYLWQRNLKSSISFRYHGNTYFSWNQWEQGLRPTLKSGKVSLSKTAKIDHSRNNFRKYLTYMFAMTGTVSNVGEPKVSYADAKPGDFFLHPAPSARVLGHAVIILDIVENSTGDKQFLLAQGFTPAQDMHVLKFNSKTAWYPVKSSSDIKTPLWRPFTWSDLRRFRY